MKWCWFALVHEAPSGAVASATAHDVDGASAGVLAVWQPGERPRPDAVRMDARVLDADGPRMAVSLVLAPPEVRVLYDDPTVVGAVKAALSGPAPDFSSTLSVDASHFGGAVSGLAEPWPDWWSDDPFVRVFPARRLWVEAGMFGRAAPPAGVRSTSVTARPPGPSRGSRRSRGSPGGRHAGGWPGTRPHHPPLRRTGLLRALLRDPRCFVSLAVIGLLAVMAVAPGWFGAGDPRDCSLATSLSRPSAAHWFGKDLQGCDYYTRTLHGARVSLVIGGAVVVLATLVGTLFGTLAGFYEGALDAVLARLTDLTFATPLVLGGAVLLSFSDTRGLLQVTLVLALLGWPPMLRLMRASVLRTKHAEYVQAARAMGARDLRLMRRHIVPNAVWPVLVYGCVYVGVAISAEALLSFAGVGLQLPTISWGLMLNEVQHRVLDAPHLLIPGAFLTLTVGAFVSLGEALRAASNPHGG